MFSSVPETPRWARHAVLACLPPKPRITTPNQNLVTETIMLVFLLCPRSPYHAVMSLCGLIQNSLSLWYMFCLVVTLAVISTEAGIAAMKTSRDWGGINWPLLVACFCIFTSSLTGKIQKSYQSWSMSCSGKSFSCWSLTSPFLKLISCVSIFFKKIKRTGSLPCPVLWFWAQQTSFQNVDVCPICSSSQQKGVRTSGCLGRVLRSIKVHLAASLLFTLTLLLLFLFQNSGSQEPMFSPAWGQLMHEKAGWILYMT